MKLMLTGKSAVLDTPKSSSSGMAYMQDTNQAESLRQFKGAADTPKRSEIVGQASKHEEEK
jgi:hypothetical protein